MPIGVVIVDHGSRRSESNELLERFVSRFADRMLADQPDDSHGKVHVIEPAHMELAEPSIATAFDCCVAKGATRVIVIPYFLAPGKHWHEDIPQLTQAAAAKHPEVEYHVGEPIGLHPMMLDVVEARLMDCLDPQPEH